MSRKGLEILGYDEAEGELRIVVSGARRHDFFDVPGPVYQALRASGSRMDYFHAEVWNRFEHRTYWGGLDELLAYLAEDFCFDPPVTVGSRRADGDTPLHVACVWGDLGAVDLLLGGGADADAPGDLGCTPLYNAVAFGYARCAGRLLGAGASPDAVNELETTPRKRALESGNPKLIALFPAAA